MTRRTAGGNNATISMARGGSVPIVSQTEINPMNRALSLILALATTTAAYRAPACRSRRGRAARARTAISRAAHSARRPGARRTPSPSRRTVTARGDGLRRGLLLLANWTRPRWVYLPVSRIPDAAMSDGWRDRRPMYERARTARRQSGRRMAARSADRDGRGILRARRAHDRRR